MDKLSRKGFFSAVVGLFAAPAIAAAIPEEPTGGYIIPPGAKSILDTARDELAVFGYVHFRPLGILPIEFSSYREDEICLQLRKDGKYWLRARPHGADPNVQHEMQITDESARKYIEFRVRMQQMRLRIAIGG